MIDPGVASVIENEERKKATHHGNTTVNKHTQTRYSLKKNILFR